MNDTTQTLPEAIHAFIKAAYEAFYYKGKIGIDFSMDMTCDEQTLTFKKWRNCEEDFEYDLDKIQKEFSEFGITLTRLPPPVTPARKGMNLFRSEEPQKETHVSFNITCTNPTAAIAALMEKTEKIKKIALETQAKRIVQSIANCIPRDMPPELEQQIADGLNNLAMQLKGQTRTPGRVILPQDLIPKGKGLPDYLSAYEGPENNR